MTENIPEARFIPMTSLAKAVGPLDGRGNLPLYQELQRALRKAIDSRLLGPDDALPSERDLAADFAVSRITVRKALDGLVADGLLVRRAGARPHAAQRLAEARGGYGDARGGAGPQAEPGHSGVPLQSNSVRRRCADGFGI